ncbi:ethylene-responsive transcription factor ERF015-like [Magnolia sinica]|uniref:ethylene-responsive transcription factor ERF015-like n=1 Tax=Magnolia sinica TaxID=86752 RepID=UPI002659A216|nr:ethylene-responsive transcription factor ERF015-like [Magnolia sinica]
MVFIVEKMEKGEFRGRKNSTGFKGIRMRKWGRWVSEIRIPKTRSRIWLGSYDTREKAARAYDAALYCLRGPGGDFNFPEERRPEFPGGMPPVLTKTDIKAIAARFACPDRMTRWGCMGPLCTSVLTAKPTTSPELPASGEVGSICRVASSLVVPSGGFSGPEEFSPESFLIGDPYMVEPGNIWDII